MHEHDVIGKSSYKNHELGFLIDEFVVPEIGTAERGKGLDIGFH